MPRHTVSWASQFSVESGILVCVFCGSFGPLTDEDVVPRWLPKLLGLTGRPAVMTTESLGKSATVVRRDQRMKLTLRAVCRRCNNTWMSVLESRFKGICGPAIVGRKSMVLAPPEQRLVATWAVKTALLMELAYRFLGEHAYAPPSNLAYLYARRGQKPPPGADTRVWIGALGPGWRDVWHQASAFIPAGDEAQPSDRVGWYLATVAVGHVVLHVFGRDIQPDVSGRASAARNHPAWSLPDQWTQHLLPVWPVISDHVHWPPPRVIPQDDLLVLHPQVPRAEGAHAEP